MASGAYVLLGGLMARELSAAPRHQVAAAAAVAMTALTLAVGHLFETTTFDMVTTAAAVWLFVRVMRSEPQRWTPWIAAGVLTGVAMEIKILAATLLVCCLLGVVICGPRSRLLSPRLWTAVAIALLMAAPNLVWQAVHGFPMLQIAANIAGGGSTSSTPRVALVPSVLLAVGPVVSIVLIVGLIVLLRSDRRGTDGWLAAGFLIFIAFLLITGGILLPGWTRSGGVGRRCRAGAGLGVPRAAVAAGVGGRVDPHLGGQHDAADAAGGSSRWTRVHDRDRAQSGSGGRGGMAGVRRSGRGGRGEHSRGAARRHIVLAQSYQQAAALDVLRPANGVTMPAVYSGHNGFWFWGPPPESATDAIVIGNFSPAELATGYAHCKVAGTVQTPPGVDNDLTGTPIHRCTGLRQPWSVLWPQAATFA